MTLSVWDQDLFLYILSYNVTEVTKDIRYSLVTKWLDCTLKFDCDPMVLNTRDSWPQDEPENNSIAFQGL